MRSGCKTLQDTAYRATKRVKTAGDESVQRVHEAESQALSRIAAASSGSPPAQQEPLVEDVEHALECKEEAPSSDPKELALARIPQEPAKRAPWELLCEARV